MDVWLPVFKAGEHTDSGGHSDEWTIDDLNQIVDLYNNQPDHEYHQAPITKGHPEDDKPSYGWVAELKRVGPVLYARFEDVDEQFLSEVRAGKFRYRSIALYPNLLLRHIAFLGAVPPAVKGLGPALMNEQRQAPGRVEVDSDQFDETDHRATAALARMSAFGIGINADRLRDKPDIYKDLTDEQFADPVHYRFPITPQHILASLASFSSARAQAEYSTKERSIVVARLVTAARKFGVQLTPFAWAYGEKTRRQGTRTQSKTLRTRQEYTDMTDQQIAQLLSWISEQFGEEVAAKVSAYLWEVKAGSGEAEAAPAEGEGDAPPMDGEGETALSDEEEAGGSIVTLPDGSTISLQSLIASLAGAGRVTGEHSDSPRRRSTSITRITDTNMASMQNRRFRELESQVAEQAFQIRAREFNEFVDEMIRQGRLTPAQRQNTLELMESMHELRQMQFSDGSLTPLDVFMKEIANRPVVVEFNDYEFEETEEEVSVREARMEFADANVDPDRLQAYVRIKEYAAANNLSTASARRALMQQGLI